MKIRKILKATPKTRTGKWSVRLIIIFIVLFTVSQISYIFRCQGSEIVTNAPILIFQLLGMLGSVGILAGLASFITGIFSIAKSKERTFWVYLAVLISLFPFAFMLGEILVPH
jgi:ABC-type multidrug transport system permease subunit